MNMKYEFLLWWRKKIFKKQNSEMNIQNKTGCNWVVEEASQL